MTFSGDWDASVSVSAGFGDGEGEADVRRGLGIRSLPALDAPSRFLGVGSGSLSGVASCTTMTGTSSVGLTFANAPLVLFLGVVVACATSIWTCWSSSSSSSESSWYRFRLTVSVLANLVFGLDKATWPAPLTFDLMVLATFARVDLRGDRRVELEASVEVEADAWTEATEGAGVRGH